jgi:hypothetical protein
MNLTYFEATIRAMGDEVSLAPMEGGKQRVLQAWRAKLGKEPTSLPSFRIDSIVREVRRRLIVNSR